MIMDKEKLIDIANKSLRLPPSPHARFPPSPYYRFLQLLTVEVKSNLSVELGVCGGGGSYHMAMGKMRSQVVGVDITNDYPDNINFIKQNCPNFIFFIGDSIEFAAIIHSKYGGIDLLFIDTTHTYEQTLAEFKAYQPYLSRKAMVCFDDLFRPGMDKAWDWLPEPKLRLDELHIGGSPTDGGFGVVWKELQRK